MMLPGLRPSRNRRYGRSPSLKLVGNEQIVEPMGPFSPTKKWMMKSQSATSLTTVPQLDGSIEAALAADKIKEFPLKRSTFVLRFFCYLTEQHVNEVRIRKMEIYYYLEDDSLRVVEPKTENSGAVQGTFIRRHRVNTDDGWITIDDVAKKPRLTIYGRDFHIYGCDPATRRYLEHRRTERPNTSSVTFAVGPPEDPYEKRRRAIMSRETGQVPGAFHGIKKNPMTAFAEAAIGRPVDNSSRAGFLKYGRAVLRFYCVDGTDLVKLHYFLLDGTVEVLRIQTPRAIQRAGGMSNSDFLFPMLLKRTKLPKPDGGSYHWKDLAVGESIHLYGRDLLLVDADQSTRVFYDNEGIPLKAKLPGLSDTGVETPKAPAPVVKKKKKEETRDDMILRYRASFADPRPQDVDRRFIVSYAVQDGTITVKEPPERNSGIIAGVFLGKNVFHHPRGDPFRPTDFVIGTTVIIGGHKFELLNADDATFKYMDAKKFPHCDLDETIDHLNSILHAKFGQTKFDKLRSLGTMSFSEFQRIFTLGGGGPLDLPKQALLVVWRFLVGSNATLDVNALINTLSPSS